MRSHTVAFVRVIGVGPRLASLLVEITDEKLKMEDVHRILPLKSHQTAQLCGFVFHDHPDTLLQFPLNMMLIEYGFQVGIQALSNRC